MTPNELKSTILTDFLQMLERTYHLSTNPINIITSEPANKLEDLLPASLKNQSAFIEIKEEAHPDVILKNLTEALPNKKFIFLKVNGIIPPKVHHQLNLLSQEGFMDASVAKRPERVEEKLPRESFVILVGKREILENQHGNLFNISAHFLDLT